MDIVDNLFREDCDKTSVNPAPYYALFDKYIPRYEDGGREKNILLYGIGNLDVLRNMMEVNLEANYVIAEVEKSTLEIIKIYDDFKKYNINVAHISNSDDYLGVLRTKDMKFNCIIMNPPWGGTNAVGLGRKILKEAFKHVTSDNDSTIVCLYGENEIFCVQSMNRKQEYEYCEEVETKRSSDFFDVGARINFVISKFTPNVKHDKMKCTFHHDSAWNGNYSVNEIFHQMKLPKEFVDLFKTTETVYNNLMDKSLEMGICNESNDQFEYFENKAKNESHKNSAVKDSKFKLIINRTSYEHPTDPYFDYVKNMGGCTWTCKNERIRNNMLYWLSECSLSYLWKKYFLNDTAACYAYSCLPAVDFDKDETEFKNWCNNLVPGFNSKYSIDDIVKMRYR